MADRGPGVVVPLALLSAGLLLMSGMGKTTPQSPAPAPPLDPNLAPRVRVQLIQRGQETPFDIFPSQVVRVTSSLEPGPGQTSIRLHRTGVSDDYILGDFPSSVVTKLGKFIPLIKVHEPTGATSPRSGPEWDEEPSMELTPIWISRAYLQMIGPSPSLHYRRRRLGKLYTIDGLDIELYESLDDLSRIVGPDVPNITEKFRP